MPSELPIFKEFRAHVPAHLSLFLSSVFSGMTSVAIPISLSASGITKEGVATFFVVGAVVAAFYNLGVLPLIARKGYPATAFRISSGCVPIGVIGISCSAGNPVLLYASGAVMLTVTLTIPQVFGRASRAVGNDTKGLVVTLRQTMILGFICGLGLFSGVAAVGMDALSVAAAVACLASIPSWLRYFRGSYDRIEPDASSRSSAAGPHNLRNIGLLCATVALVGGMKAVDTLRGVYLPLYAVAAGWEPAVIAPLFLATALTEVAVLPLLGRLSTRLGSPMTLALVCTVGAVSFAMLVAGRGYATLLGAQLVYAVFAAGFQSIGMIALAEVTGRDLGRGAAMFMTVVQAATVIGVLLPLFAPGYSAAIFLVAAAVCVTCLAVAIALHFTSRTSTPPPTTRT